MVRSQTLAVLALAGATAAPVSLAATLPRVVFDATPPGVFFDATPRQESKERERGIRAGARPRIGPALAKRIRGEARLDDVRVDVEWPLAGKLTSARVYGRGVGIWDRRAQFRLSRLRAVAVLMHGYRYHAHEAPVGEIARDIGFTQVSGRTRSAR